MEWIISIENKPKERIVVIFDPLRKELLFNGQHRFKNEWYNFVIVKHDINVNTEEIQNTLLETYEKLKALLESYADITEIFKEIKTIEIKE